MNKQFLTQEIGSLAKPKWRAKGCRGEPLSTQDIAEAVKWGNRLGIEKLEELVVLLRGIDSPGRRKSLYEWSALYAIRFFEAAGLDIFFDGEQWRSEMYEHVMRRIAGLRLLGYVKSFDYRYFNKAACVEKPKYDRSLYLEEFLFTKENTECQVKVPFTGPYTLVDWTFNEYYEKKLVREIKNFKKRKFEAKRQFVFDMIREVLRPEIRKLVNSGANWIQIDEPAATTNPTDDEMQLFVEAFNKLVEGFHCTFSLHNCYSNYAVLAKYAPQLQNCSQLALELANRDSRKTGIDGDREGYHQIKMFEEHGFEGRYGLGVIDVHTDFIEPPELVRDRILYATNVVGDPSRIFVSTDCGLRTRTWEISYRKLRNMISGAQLARKACR